MKVVQAFVTNDVFADNNPSQVASIFEISDYSLTFSKHKQLYSSVVNPNFNLIVFNVTNNSLLTSDEQNRIFRVLFSFIDFIPTVAGANKTQAIQLFISSFNLNNPTIPLTFFNFNTLITLRDTTASDSLTFRIGTDFEVHLWLSNNYFKNFFPLFEIDIVTPFDNFRTLLNNPAELSVKLEQFDFVTFNERISRFKGTNVSTYVTILNIPYQLPNTTIQRNCHFAFIVYGRQGNYEFILRLRLFDYLTETLGIPSSTVERLFPTILKINEFFIIPEWNKYAIPSHVGHRGIHSQISLTYSEPFTIDRYVRVIENREFLRNNTYNVPIDYNNLLLNVVNGEFSETSKQKFIEYYFDMITVFSMHTDFARMSRRTQRFMTILEHALAICDSNTSVEFLNKVISNESYSFRIISRRNIEYLSINYEDHQYYFLPKYEHRRLS